MIAIVEAVADVRRATTGAPKPAVNGQIQTGWISEPVAARRSEVAGDQTRYMTGHVQAVGDCFVRGSGETAGDHVQAHPHLREDLGMVTV